MAAPAEHHDGMDLAGTSSGREKVQRVVVRGRVEAGVEPGSVVLVAELGAAVYQLGRAWEHAVGRRVDVVAQTMPGVMTTAQQGAPVQVLSLTVVDAPGPGGAADAGEARPSR